MIPLSQAYDSALGNNILVEQNTAQTLSQLTSTLRRLTSTVSGLNVTITEAAVTL